MTAHSPFRISILLHFHVSPEPHPRQSEEYDAGDLFWQTVTEFRNKGIIYLRHTEPDVYGTTNYGAAWVQALCNVPVPVVGYIDQQGNVLGHCPAHEPVAP